MRVFGEIQEFTGLDPNICSHSCFLLNLFFFFFLLLLLLLFVRFHSVRLTRYLWLLKAPPIFCLFLLDNFSDLLFMFSSLSLFLAAAFN